MGTPEFTRKVIEYNGRKYRQSKTNPRYFYDDRYYGTGHKGRKKIGLHRQVYEDNYGKIPKGYAVHHKDGNVLNNSSDNLEAMPRGKHTRAHMKTLLKDDVYRSKIMNGLEKARKEAPKWHRSKEGREWHIQHYEKSLKTAKKYLHICAVCGASFFSTRIRKAKYCSDKCRHRRIP